MARDFWAIGQAAEYAYGSNTYRFSVVPNRIVLDHNADTVFADKLIEAARHVADTLQSQSQDHGVTGLGFNYESIFSQSDGGRTGTEFCAGLCDADQIQQAIGSNFHEAHCNVVVLTGGVRYTLRLEPHLASTGANLFLNANGHQDVATGDDLSTKLNKAVNARAYTQAVSSSLSREFEGDQQ